MKLIVDHDKKTVTDLNTNIFMTKTLSRGLEQHLEFSFQIVGAVTTGPFDMYPYIYLYIEYSDEVINGVAEFTYKIVSVNTYEQNKILDEYKDEDISDVIEIFIKTLGVGGRSIGDLFVQGTTLNIIVIPMPDWLKEMILSGRRIINGRYIP